MLLFSQSDKLTTMTSELLELEGTWEEILQQADKLAGHRLRVTVLADAPVTSKRLSEFYGILPATKPYPGKAEIRANVAHSLAQQNLKNTDD